MNNERFECSEIRETVTPAICAMRLSTGFVECKECPKLAGINAPGFTTPSYAKRGEQGVGNLIGGEIMAKGPCNVEGCASKEAKDGLCFRHYKQRNGVPPWGQSKKTPGGGIAVIPKKPSKPKKDSGQAGMTKAGPVPEAALMGAIRKYAMDGVRAEVLPVIERIEKDLAELKERLAG